MKTRIDPISIIVVSILLGWGWTQATKPEQRPICQVQVIKDGQTILVPRYCDEIFTDENASKAGK